MDPKDDGNPKFGTSPGLQGAPIFKCQSLGTSVEYIASYNKLTRCLMRFDEYLMYTKMNVDVDHHSEKILRGQRRAKHVRFWKVL